MGFPGVWMTESASCIYRVVPKCACSTIGQALYFSDHGTFFDGDIHDAQTGILKWSMEDRQDQITHAALHKTAPAFSCVRNPYTRILSTFFDKIAGIQRNGKRYRGNLVPEMAQSYGVQVDGDFDQIASFRRFLLFARDTIRWRKPMDPDIHWSSITGHIATFVANGGRFDHIIFTEDFKPGMQRVLSQFESRHTVDLDTMPRFNDSEGHGPGRAHPVTDYFDDLSRHLVYEIYKQDFDLFNYDPQDPGQTRPLQEVDLDKLHAQLSA